MDSMTNENQNEEIHAPEDDISIVGSYRFELFQDATDAAQELKNIDSLKKKIDFTKHADMIKLYSRLVERRVFHTQVGYQFLAEFREYLVEQAKQGNIAQEEIDKLPFIVVQSAKGMSRLDREQLEYLQKENDGLKKNRGRYLIALIVLGVLVVTLFVLTLANPNVGYINTENKILNKYASWEETLKQREKEVKDREAALGISTEETYAPDVPEEE